MSNRFDFSRGSIRSIGFRSIVSTIVSFPLMFMLLVQPVLADSSSSPDWDGAKRIDKNDYADAAVVAADELGNAIAVWTQYDASPQEYGLWANRFDTKSGWSKPRRINQYNGQAAQPSIAMNANGDAIVVWMQYGIFDPNNPGPVGSSLWVSTLSDKKDWSEPLQIADETVNALFPKVAIDDYANSIVVWAQTNPDLDISNIYARRYSNHDGWGDATLIQEDTNINANTAQIAMNASGDATVVWGQIHPLDNYTFDIGVNQYNANTGWNGAQSLPGSEGANTAQVGVDSRGNAMVVFSRMDTSTYQDNIFASREKRHGWDAPLLLQDSTDINASSFHISVNGDGVALAIWKETAYSYFGDFTFGIHVNRFEPRAGWQGQQLIGTESTNWSVTQMNAQVGLDKDGNAMAVWELENPAAATDPYAPTPTNVMAYRYTNRKGWDAGQSIQKRTDNAGKVQLSVTQSGEAFATWQQQDMVTGVTSLWANHFSR